MKKFVILLLVFSLLLPLHSEQFFTVSESQLVQLETTIDNQQNLLNEWEEKSKTWETALNNQNQIIQQQSKQLQKSEKTKKLMIGTLTVSITVNVVLITTTALMLRK
jgi:septal ring factor EnvC (AmiA/AmiB activator)